MRNLWLTIFLLFAHIALSSKVDSLINVLNNSTADTIKFNTYSLIIKELINVDPAEAQVYAQNQLEIAKSKKELAKSYLHLGLTFDYQYKFLEGISNYHRSLKLYKELNDSIGMSRVLLNFGIIFYYKGDMDSSIYYYVKTLDISESIKLDKITASAIGNLGAIHRDLEEYETALKYENRSLQMDIEAGYEEGMAKSYNNIGLSYRGLGNYSKALEYYNKSLEIRKRINDESGLAAVLTNIGQVYYHMKDFKNALEFNLKSVEYEQKLGNMIGVAESNINIGECYLELGQVDKSVEYLENALITADSINTPNVILAALGGLSASYAKLGWYEKAYIVNQRYAQLQDSTFKESRMKQVKELETKYNTEKAEKENELLKKENTINQLQLEQKGALERNLIIGLALLILILTLVFYAYRVNINSSKKLAQRNHKIELMNNQLQLKNKEITDSIIYAKRIQEAILPPDDLVNELLAESFIYYQPKDIVSGDFYWMEQIKDEILLAAVDCTGHGVPGAFMSIVGNNGLNKAVKEQANTEPAIILDILNEHVVSYIQNNKRDVKDGMDIVLCNIKNNTLKFSGANNPLYLVRDQKLIIYKGDKQAIGDAWRPFAQHTIELQKDDRCYIFTDGYADQFGGEKNKKFSIKRFRETLLRIHQFPMSYQKTELERILDEWKGNEEQLDDICVIGFKV